MKDRFYPNVYSLNSEKINNKCKITYCNVLQGWTLRLKDQY